MCRYLPQRISGFKAMGKCAAILMIMILASSLSFAAVFAAAKTDEDYSKKAQELHEKATYKTEILELQALYFQNREIIDNLNEISESLKAILNELKVQTDYERLR